MSVHGVTQFSGMAGRVLWGTMGARSLASGFVVGLIMIVGTWALVMATADALVTPFTQIVFALALARFALNGQYGEWEGTVFSGVGGTWTEVVGVALRYLVLTFVWLLPLILLGLEPQMMAAAGPMGSPDNKTIAILGLYLLGSTLTPPILLIVAVTASNLSELFSARHWSGVFGGMLDEVFAIYAIYTGGVGMALVLVAPIVLLAFLADPKFGLFVAAIAFAFLFGISLNLLGRLCGFFALGDFDLPEREPAHAAGPHPRQSAPTLPTDEPIGSPDTPGPPDSPLPPVQQPATPTSASPARPPQVIDTQPVPRSPLPLSPMTPEQASEPMTTAMQHEAHSRKPPLLDAKQHIEATLSRFKQDPGSALTALEDLRESYAPHPHVLWALCICRHRAGDVEGAFELAGPGLRLCFARGHTHLAADIFRELRVNAKRLGLNREQILAIAGAATTKKDFSTAGEAYSMIIAKDPGDQRAVKGMIQVAEGLLHEKSNPAMSVKVYRFLLDRCGDSPLAEFAQTGLETAARQLTKVKS